MHSLQYDLLILITGVVSGFTGAIGGGGGFLSIAILLLLGLPPKVSIATNRLGALGITIGSLANFYDKSKIKVKLLPQFIIFAILGSIIGGFLLVSLNSKVLNITVAVLLISELLFLILNKNIGLLESKSGISKLWGSVFYIIVFAYGAFFGGGSLSLAYFGLIFFWGFDFLTAMATNTIPWFIMSIISLCYFSFQKIVDFKIGIFLLLGMLLGSYIGTFVAIKKGNKWIKLFTIVVLMISAIALIFS